MSHESLGSIPNGQAAADDDNKSNPYACLFSKSLPHDEDGRVNEKQYKTLLKCLRKKDVSLLSEIKLGTTDGLKLVSLSSVFASELFGKKMNQYKVSPAPRFFGSRQGKEMDELYAMARLRDVPFVCYSHDKTVQAVCKSLSLWEDTEITPQKLFRTHHSRGPFVSQFLFFHITNGLEQVEQKYHFFKPGKDYLVSESQLLDCRNGKVTLDSAQPFGQVVSSEPRYISTLRDLASLVKNDPPTQIIHNALLILSALKIPTQHQENKSLAPCESGFVTLGMADVWELCGRVTKLAFDACWYIKYTNLAARPEEMGWYLTQSMAGNRFYKKRLAKGLYTSRNVEWAVNKYGSALLPQAYAEGSPAHPSYTSGHATVAAAQATILKAWFSADAVLPYTLIPDHKGQNFVKDECLQLNVHDELNKLVYNVGGGRQAAGIHFSSDSTAGYDLGEQVAIAFLKEAVLRYKQPIQWKFSLLNGKRILISNRA